MTAANEQPFKIGEDAILINCEVFPEYNNTSCTINGVLTLRAVMNSDSLSLRHVMAYSVICQDGRIIAPTPWQLKRRIRSPEKQKEVSNSA